MHRTLVYFLILQFVVLEALVLAVGAHGWDDGAITLAFSRTFADTGRIALTSVSEQVEGFSTVSWFLVNTLFAFLHPSFWQSIALSQFLTVVTLLLTSIATWLICADLELLVAERLLALVLVSFAGPALAEAMNGMEMGLMAASSAWITYFYLAPRGTRLFPWLPIVVLTLVSTRFEACFYLAFLAAPLLLERRFRLFVVTGLIGAAGCVVLAVLRWYAFDAVLPNTVLAKMQDAYSQPGLSAAIGSRLKAFTELPRYFLVPLGFIAVLGGRRLPQLLARLDVKVLYLLAPVLAALVFSAIAGRNWGHAGRMQFFAFPQACVLVALLVARIRAQIGIPRPRLVMGGLAAATLVASVAFAFPSLIGRGGPAAMIAVTAADYRETGLRVEALRRALDLPSISFWTPDVGGVGLCCDAIRVVDSALLTNRELATRGYGAVDDVLRVEAPHVIETHGEWSRLAGLYNRQAFVTKYRPALVGATRLFLRNDIAAELLVRQQACLLRPGDIVDYDSLLINHRYAGLAFAEDDAYFRSFGEVVFVKYTDDADYCGGSHPTDRSSRVSATNAQ